MEVRNCGRENAIFMYYFKVKDKVCKVIGRLFEREKRCK